MLVFLPCHFPEAPALLLHANVPVWDKRRGGGETMLRVKIQHLRCTAKQEELSRV